MNFNNVTALVESDENLSFHQFYNQGPSSAIKDLINFSAPDFEHFCLYMRISKLTIHILSHVYKLFVTDMPNDAAILGLVKKKTTFSSSFKLINTVDVTFYDRVCPSASIEKGKLFSGKNHLYEVKVKVSVLPNRLKIFAIENYSDSVRFSIFLKYQRLFTSCAHKRW